MEKVTFPLLQEKQQADKLKYVPYWVKVKKVKEYCRVERENRGAAHVLCNLITRSKTFQVFNNCVPQPK